MEILTHLKRIKKGDYLLRLYIAGKMVCTYPIWKKGRNEFVVIGLKTYENLNDCKLGAIAHQEKQLELV